MAGITPEVAQARLEAWLAADAAVAGGQEYEIDTGNGRRRLRRADAAVIRENIAYWQKWVANLTPGVRRRTKYVVPE